MAVDNKPGGEGRPALVAGNREVVGTFGEAAEELVLAGSPAVGMAVEEVASHIRNDSFPCVFPGT